MKAFALIIVCLLALHNVHCGETFTFQDVIDAIIQRRLTISKHEFFSLLSDETVPVQKRMRFIPYWTYFAMTFADVVDNWIRIPEPRNELEDRINAFADEDSFHYNLYLYDVENVMGYGLDRYGSYTAIMRHLWGDDSKAVRMLLYTWIAAVKNTDDPLVKLASIETIEAGLKDIFEVTFTKVYGGKDSLPDLKYFGLTHVELEVNHTQTSWFKEGDEPFRPLASFEMSKESKDTCLAVVNDMFDRFHDVYDYMYNLSMAEESIYPEKYSVEGYPAVREFPKLHPNRQDTMSKFSDEL